MNSVLPEKFLDRLTDIVGQSLFSEIEKTFVERPTTFRVNTLKTTREEVLEYLKNNAFKVRQIVWYKDAFVLLNKTKRELCETPIYEQGKIYVQSLASMVPPLVLEPQPGEKILDLTAAPGSKTSQIAALMGRVGELVANDNNKVRFFKLKHNMECLNVIPTETREARQVEGSLSEAQKRDSSAAARNDKWVIKLRMEHGADLCREYENYFDKILLDAPCSAEARFVIGEPESTGYWKEQKIKEMAYKQWQLLLGAWNALKSGGILVYSTCTFAPEENELQITKFLERIGENGGQVELLDINLGDLKRLPNVKKWKTKEVDKEVIKKTFRIFPTKEIEGFYIAKIKKN